MKTIDIRPDDLLWRLYCKTYTVEGKEVGPPKNLCNYFWTAFDGFLLWISREVRLWILWLFGIISGAFLVGGAYIVPDSGIITILWILLFGTLFAFSFVAMISTTVYRATRFLKQCVPWLIPAVMLSFTAFLITHVITGGIFWPGITAAIGDLLLWIAYLILALTGLIITMSIVVCIVRKISPLRFIGLQRFFEAVGAFIDAKKKRICPLVNPPKEENS